MHGALDVVWSILLLTVLVLFRQVYVDVILSDKDYF